MYTKTEDLFSPRAGIIFKPQENVSIYLSYSDTFSPKAGEQYKKMTNDSTLGSSFGCSETENMEIGLKVALSDDLFLTAAYFDAESTQMKSRTVDGVDEQYGMVNKEVDGYEIELSGSISDQLELTMSYADFEAANEEQSREIPDYHFYCFCQLSSQP